MVLDERALRGDRAVRAALPVRDLDPAAPPRRVVPGRCPTPTSSATSPAILKDTLQRLNRALDRPPYNFVIHTAPVSEGELEYYHWHLEIMPKLTRVAGFEIGSGFYINPTPPEDAAQYLREIAVEDVTAHASAGPRDVNR